MNKRVCHITTLHPAKDTRIFHKECASLAKEGFEVYLIVANQQSEVDKAVHIENITVPSSRIQRILRAPKLAFEKALALDAAIYHFHDPELLPIGSKLKKQGKIVLYDSHEDVPRQILAKPYIPSFLRGTISRIFEKYENRIVRQLDGVISPTPHIENRFKAINTNSVAISNFPILDKEPLPDWSERKNEIVYVGTLTSVRGIKELVASLEHMDTRLNLAGNWWVPSFQAAVMNIPSWSKVNNLGYINQAEIKKVLQRSKVGIVTLHPIVSYKVAYAIKMFEYMAAGIPVVASNFPLWRSIIEKAGCGICVDPLDPKAIAKATQYLLDNEAEAKAMGERGRAVALQYYTWASQEQKLIALYYQLLDQNK